MTNKHTPESQWVINYLMGIQRTGRHVPMATMLLVADSESAAITERDKLLAVNAELLAALKILATATAYYFRDFEHLHESINGPLNNARAVIASAEEGK